MSLTSSGGAGRAQPIEDGAVAPFALGLVERGVGACQEVARLFVRVEDGSADAEGERYRLDAGADRLLADRLHQAARGALGPLAAGAREHRHELLAPVAG